MGNELLKYLRLNSKFMDLYQKVEDDENIKEIVITLFNYITNRFFDGDPHAHYRMLLLLDKHNINYY